MRSVGEEEGLVGTAAFRDRAWMSPGEWAGVAAEQVLGSGLSRSLGTAGSCPLSMDLCLGITVPVQKQGAGAQVRLVVCCS